MSLIDQYLAIQHEIKERALHVNNLVAEYIQENDIDDDSYRFSWCGVAEIDYLDFTLAGHKIILEFDNGGGWPTTWEVPVTWIDLEHSDEDVIECYLTELERRREYDKMTELSKLGRQANELGFYLVKQ